MLSPERKEIKRALMGRTYPLEDGRLAVMAAEDYRLPIGVSDGAGSVLLFGIGRRAVSLKAAGKQGSAKKAAKEAMAHVGRELVLIEQPDTVACIRRYRLTRPVVLTFSYADDVPVLSAWTGRGPLSFIARRLAVRSFLKHAPKGLSLAPKKDGGRNEADKEGREKN